MGIWTMGSKHQLVKYRDRQINSLLEENLKCFSICQGPFFRTLNLHGFDLLDPDRVDPQSDPPSSDQGNYNVYGAIQFFVDAGAWQCLAVLGSA